MGKRLGRLCALILLTVTGVVGWSAPPAAAALCAPGSGVSVVLDFTTVPGGGSRGVETTCLPNGGGKSAYDLFKAAGYDQKSTTRFPGFICRIDGLPASDPCFTASPADAYWGLFWSDGKAGTWTYSNLGVMGLTIPNGGSVAWNFQNNSNTTTPRATPPQSAGVSAGGQGSGSAHGPGQVMTTRSATATSGTAAGTSTSKRAQAGSVQPRSTKPTVAASAAPAKAPSVAPSPGSSTPVPTPSLSPPPSSRGAATPPSATTSTVPAPVAEAGATSDVESTSATAAGEGLPGWVPLVIIGLLAAGASTVAVLRRRSVHL